jgi:hypothetical protein
MVSTMILRRKVDEAGLMTLAADLRTGRIVPAAEKSLKSHPRDITVATRTTAWR